MATDDDRIAALDQRFREQVLKDHLTLHANEKELVDVYRRAHEEIHGMEQKALETAVASEARMRDMHAQAHSEAHRAHEQQHASEARALEQAAHAMDKRLDGMNQFRDQLRDQAATFITRDAMAAHTEEFTARWETVRQRIDSVEDTLQRQFDRRVEELRNLIGTEREERRAQEGSRRGSSATVAWVVAGISALGGILGILIVFANYSTV